MVSILVSLIMVTAIGVANSANVNRFGNAPGGYNNKMSRSSGGVGTEEPVYLLISTSSKLYCMKVPAEVSRLHSPHHYKLNHGYYDDIRNYEVIYEEKAHVNNWITDAFYVKSESLIYVNVYNSSSASSDIFTLKYDSEKGQWVKTVLYKDQSYCLGIAYNEERRELYWTAARSILAGSSYPASTPSRAYRVLFNLDLAKKLLYLKYDQQSDSLYVSTLNYIYACSLRTNECKIVVRDLLSARGVYVDSVNRNLYVVDHKKRNIKRTKLVDESSDALVEQADDYASAVMSQNTVSTVMSSDTMPDIGDIFYMTVLAKNNANLLIWSEFSGKIKIANLNDTSNYRVIFSTNEYTYSVNVMDNSTNVFTPTSTTTTTTTSSTTTTSTTTTTEEITTVESTTEEPTTEATTSLVGEVESAATDAESSTILTGESTNIEEETGESATTLVEEQLSSSDNQPIDQEETDQSTTSTSTPAAVQVQSTSTEIVDENGEVLQAVDDHEIAREEVDSEAEVGELDVVEPKTGVTESTTTTTHEDSVTTTSARADEEDTNSDSDSEITTKQFTFVQKLSENETADVAEDSDPIITMSSASSSSSGAGDQVQNLRGVNIVKQPTANENEPSSSSSSGQAPLQQQQPSSSSSYNLIRTSSSASHQLNVALYIVICLLVFSLIINIILLYVSKMRQQSREKLIITHEICDKSETMPSQRSGLTAKMSSNSEELTECNINLINHNGSATSALDGEQ